MMLENEDLIDGKNVTRNAHSNRAERLDMKVGQCYFFYLWWKDMISKEYVYRQLHWYMVF